MTAPLAALPRRLTAAALLLTTLVGCGANQHDDNGVTANTTSVTPATLAQTPGAPASTGDIALDAYHWINFRRGQAGLAPLARNGALDAAAVAHSGYQQINNVVSHDEIAGLRGYTGASVADRLAAAGYGLTAPYALGEVIAATSANSGAMMTEQLITAIYHRFVILEPVFKDVGTGNAGAGNGYNYLSADFAASNGYGAGLGPATVAPYPYSGQTAVPTVFYSDAEAPDPVPNQNAVGYPVSVQADIGRTLQVQSFTLRPSGGAVLLTRLLSADTDPETPASAAAIIPLAVLTSHTTYQVHFSGTLDGATTDLDWQFTTL